MMRERLLPSSILSGLLDMAAQKQIPTETLLREAGIDPNIIGDENSHLSNEQVSAVVLRVSAKLDDPAFGLHLGESAHKSIQNIAGPFFSSSESLRTAFEKLVLYQDLIIPLVELDIEENEQYVDILMEIYEGDFERDVISTDEALLIYISTCEILAAGLWGTSRQFLSEDFHILETGFRYPAPEYADEYRTVFNSPVLFDQKRNYLRIDKELFDRKLYSALPATHKKAEQQVVQKLKKLKKSESILNIVKDYIREHVSDEDLSLDNAAKQLHMTGRTLQRTLRMENTSFIDIRDNVRSEISLYYLEHTDISVEDIAERVGFSDASGFYTAFKRWHGVPPGSFRK